MEVGNGTAGRRQCMWTDQGRACGMTGLGAGRERRLVRLFDPHSMMLAAPRWLEGVPVHAVKSHSPVTQRPLYDWAPYVQLVLQKQPRCVRVWQ
jgi:hypothetical protein